MEQTGPMDDIRSASDEQLLAALSERVHDVQDLPPQTPPLEALARAILDGRVTLEWRTSYTVRGEGTIRIVVAE